MSIILSPNIASFHDLKEKYPGRVAALEGHVAPKAFDSIPIGIVNLMPTKEATERQWSSLMVASDHWIEPVWIQMDSYTPKNTESSYLDKAYIGCEAVDLSKLQGVIITGAPVELLAFEKVLYWNELSQFMDRVLAAHIPILSVCWGAQALLYKRFGIDKFELEEKCFGIFEHRFETQHSLLKNMKQPVHLPHSRHTGWREKDLEEAKALKILIRSRQAGVFALEDQDGNIYWSGHPEYEKDTLLLEYHRDVAKELDIRPPVGYERDPSGNLVNAHQWHETAKQLLTNWIDEIGGNKKCHKSK